jgi:alcohol dehydrogenase
MSRIATSQGAESMRAAYIMSYGKTELQIGERPSLSDADLGAEQVLLQVHVVALNPADIKMRKGEVKVFNKPPSLKNPVVLGCDCSGVIVALGSKVDKEWKIGDRVFCVSTTGALAPLTRVHQENLAKIPVNLGYGEAASIVTAGMTAYQMLLLVGAAEGKVQKLLVTAGAGGVGHLAIQLAKRVYNIKTVATTASGAKHDFVRSCGADIAIDYTLPGADGDFVRILRKDPGLCDAALDCTGETSKCKKVIKPGGMVVGILGLPDGQMLKQVTRAYHMDALPSCVPPLLDCITACSGCCSGVRVKNIITLPWGWQLADMTQRFADGAVRPTVDRVYPLEKAAEAFDYVETGRVVGKVLVEVVPGAAKDVQPRNPL